MDQTPQPPPLMSEPPFVAAPPVMPEAPVPDASAPLPKWRAWVLLLVMAAYPLSLGLIGAHGQEASSSPQAMLPETVKELWISCGQNLGIFAAFFVLAWGVARPGKERLYLKWRNPFVALGLGIVWSIGLRILVAALVLVAVAGVWIWGHFHGQSPDAMEGLRPKIENVISPAALHNPLYLLMILTVVSFVLAGLREELWRAAMIAGVVGVLPVRWQGRRGEILAVVLGAIVFGLGHLPQGVGGVFLTGVLGLGLGGILIGHRSLWIAVLAHGFFDATSFLGLWAADRAGLLKQVLGG